MYVDSYSLEHKCFPVVIVFKVMCLVSGATSGGASSATVATTPAPTTAAALAQPRADGGPCADHAAQPWSGRTRGPGGAGPAGRPGRAARGHAHPLHAQLGGPHATPPQEPTHAGALARGDH